MTERKLALAADRQQLKLSELMLIQLFPQQQMMARGADNLLRLLTANISKTSWQLTTTFFFLNSSTEAAAEFCFRRCLQALVCR